MSNENVTITATVQEISEINFSGNIIPQSWFNFIKFPSGKPDLLGVMILSEIVYWYRSSEIRDEATGQVISYKKKFKADKLQRNYQSFADQFGVSKRQVQASIKRLRDGGMIETELRTIIPDSGPPIPNVLYVVPVPKRIKEITYPPKKIGKKVSYNRMYDTTQSNVIGEGGSYNQMYDTLQSNVTGHTFECMTNTEITTKTTTENNDDDTFHPAKELGAPEGAECDDEETYVWLIPDQGENNPAEILQKHNIVLSDKNPATENCLKKLKEYTADEIEAIGRVLREKESAGKIKNAAGLLLQDPGVSQRILEGKFYPTDFSMQGKKRRAITNWKKEASEYEIFVPPERN